MSQDNEENKKSSKSDTLDKIFMGAVIGGAIGSVLGASIAPKKGKETRRDISDAVKNTGKGSLKLFQKIKKLLSFGKKKNVDQNSTESLSHPRSSIKKIPNEESVGVDKNS